MMTETEETISLHGLGFIQVKLGGNQRLHVWHPDLPRRKCFAYSQIHDHRFGFVSRVLAGTMINRVYKVIGGSEYVAYKHEGERTRFGNRPWTTDGQIDVVELYKEEVKAGEEYSMAPYVYHSTHPLSETVATVIRKTINLPMGAHSLCNAAVRPDVDFDRKQCSPIYLWSVVLKVLGDDPKLGAYLNTVRP